MARLRRGGVSDAGCLDGEQQMDDERVRTKRYIVSVRIDEKEKEALDQVRLKTCKCVSDIIREAMQLALQEAEDDSGVQSVP